MTRHLIRLISAASLVLATLPAVTRAQMQIPQRFENLQVLPKDIPRDTLIQIMRAFSMGLGVRCTFCHVAVREDTTERLVFKSDDKAEKRNARVMMKMTREINASFLPQLPQRHDPPVRVQCVTCHRGSATPRTLDVVLEETIAKFGVDSAVARYRRLREETLPLGRYNFGELTLSELARRLGEEGKTAEAIAMLELNQEFYPKSGAIDFQLGQLYERRGERDQAVARYRAALTKEPENRMARRRLMELGVNP
jgi:hypothetical protein